MSKANWDHVDAEIEFFAKAEQIHGKDKQHPIIATLEAVTVICAALALGVVFVVQALVAHIRGVSLLLAIMACSACASETQQEQPIEKPPVLPADYVRTDGIERGSNLGYITQYAPKPPKAKKAEPKPEPAPVAVAEQPKHERKERIVYVVMARKPRNEFLAVNTHLINVQALNPQK